MWLYEKQKEKKTRRWDVWKNVTMRKCANRVIITQEHACKLLRTIIVYYIVPSGTNESLYNWPLHVFCVCLHMFNWSKGSLFCSASMTWNEGEESETGGQGEIRFEKIWKKIKRTVNKGKKRTWLEHAVTKHAKKWQKTHTCWRYDKWSIGFGQCWWIINPNNSKVDSKFDDPSVGPLLYLLYLSTYPPLRIHILLNHGN